MSHESWGQFLDSFRAEHPVNFYASKQDLKRFAEFARQLPAPERIPLLLNAYDRYRASASSGRPKETAFESSCYSILISTLLKSGIHPDRHQAAEILRKSYHQCGHGSDVEPPLELAESAFRDQPYSAELFDAILAYRETLRSSRSTTASNLKRKLSWVLWHDPRRNEKACHTRRIQQDIHSMDAKTAFRWQYLLRNTAAGLQASPGKGWIKEARKRLAPIGERQFLSRLGDWFTFPDQEIPLSAAGSTMLRLLVWYGALVDAERSLPVLTRLVHARWNKRAPVGKVMSALAWMLRGQGEKRFEEEARIICDKFAGESAEVKRLEELYFPERAQVRKQAELEERERTTKERQARLEATLQALREKNAHVFGPDGPAGRGLSAIQKSAESKPTH